MGLFGLRARCAGRFARSEVQLGLLAFVFSLLPVLLACEAPRMFLGVQEMLMATLRRFGAGY